MSYSSKAVANKILELGRRDSIEISPMKLQKLVYYAHGWHLALNHEPLIDEQVECWQYGPVIRTLFHAFKNFGSSPITIDATETEQLKDDDVSGWGFSFETVRPEIPPADESSLSVIDSVWEAYKNYSASHLSNMTHVEGTPWKIVYDQYNGAPPKGSDIPQDEIKKYFSNQFQGA